jgi:RHS repeat-associated protein
MNKREYIHGGGGARFARLTAVLLAFLFVLTPVVPVLAAEEPAVPVESSEPISEVSPVDNPEALPEVPSDPESILESPDNTDSDAMKDKKDKPKDEEPQPTALASSGAVGPLSQLGKISESKNRLTPEVDDLTGSLIHKYQIVIPPGRNEMTPGVSLVYNSSSSSSDSIIGSGWSIDIPSIQRMNKDGIDNLYSESYYVSSLDGELVSLGSGYYGSKDEDGNFNKYSLSSNVWTVTDKAGTVYKFGTNAAERQDNPSDSTKIFKWMLQEVRDTNNNYIKYEYYKDAGQIYPLTITYTGNGSTDGIFTVNFVTSSRTGAPTTYDTGFSVKSNYRITEINTKISGTWSRKYTLAYTTGDNGSGSLLDTIEESGQDESSNVTTLPVTNFDYKTATASWSYTSTFTDLQDLINTSNGADTGLRIGDINGDGLPDQICHNDTTAIGSCNRNTSPIFYLNTGSSWVSNSSWAFPNKQGGTGTEAFLNSSFQDTGLRLFDVNADGFADLVRQPYVYLNNGSSWVYDSSFSGFPDIVVSGSDTGRRIGDINGDGLPDILCHNDSTSSPSCNNTSSAIIHINTGSGWTTSSTWDFPFKVGSSTNKESFLNSSMQDTGLRLIDVNTDGLADLIRQPYVYLNNGSGWTYTSSFSGLEDLVASGNDTGRRLGDMNGDGLPDQLCHNDTTSAGSCNRSSSAIFNINTGINWATTTAWAFPNKQGGTGTEAFLNSSFVDTGLRLIDVNGDNLPDLIRQPKVYLNNTSYQVNYLNQITYPQGGNTQITYKTTPSFKDGSNNLLNPALPMTMQVVSQVVNNDGLGNSETYNYEYAGGSYYFNTYLDRKFAGFNKVTETDAAGNKVINYYHQGNSSDSSNGEYSDHISKMGKVYRTEVKDSSGNIYLLTVNKWDKYDLGSGRSFIKNVRTTELTYDGDSDHKDKAEEYTYDNTYGNLTQKIEWGEVTASTDGSFTDTGSDKFTTDITYAANTTPYIVGLPSQDTKTDQSSAKVAENKYYYDSQTLGNVTDGNLTKQEMWKTSSTYIDIEKTYNTTYGIVTQEKDQRDKATNYSYDTYNLYPATITNALSQATSYTYDYSSGKIKQTTDPNTRVTQSIYDGLDRLKEEKQPDLATPSTLVTRTSYAYTDTSGAVKVQTTENLDGSTSVDTYTYFDGLNRKIQVRKEMEDGNYATTDNVYNNIAQLHKESVPYSSSGSSKTSATTTASLLIVYSYDPMLRVTSTVNGIGTTSNAYDDWKLSITDPRSKLKHLYKDSYGNLIKVEETNSGSTYTTLYEYNGNNKLTKITDALGNLRNFTYDGLGRRLTAQDLHASADATYGTWTYTYDDTGNLSSIVDPKSQTINYTYDDTNRVLTEDYTGVGGTEVTYTYDSGTDGVGRLTSVAASGANSSYTYNSLGLVKQDIKTINSTNYQTDYTHDRQGNVLEITNPDSSKAKYSYNTAGQLETVQRKESTDGSFINLVTDFDYGPHGKVTYQAYQNGSATTNTYDSAKMYRLSNKTTTITGGSKMQDLTYTYDANSNVTQIVDASNTNSSKTVAYTYDDLNRLLSATATNVAAGQSTYTHIYTYSAIGNMLTRTDGAGTYTYAGTNYANPHAVTSIGSVSYTYDNNGNMLTETSGLSNTWDYNNRLTQAVKGGITSTYTYDHDGQRVKLGNGTTTTYYPSKFYNTDGTTPVKHISTPDGQTLATVKGTGVGAVVYSVHTDHLTGSNVVTNSGGTQEELMDFFPYGNIRLDQKAGSFSEQRKAFGYEYDADTALSYANARYYHSGIGRFISQDSQFWNLPDDYLIDPQQQNSYSYARNNPLVYTDPTGDGIFSSVGKGLKNLYKTVTNFFTKGSSKQTPAPSSNSSTNTPKPTSPKVTQKTSTWDPVTDERIKQLDPRLQQPAFNFINNTEAQTNTQLRVVQGLRTVQEQNRLYQQGRTTPGNIVTNAKGGESYHNYGLALDVVVMEKGQPNWQKPINQDIADIGIKEGFSWGGNWTGGFKDYPHFEMTFGQSIPDLIRTHTNK